MFCAWTDAPNVMLGLTSQIPVSLASAVYSAGHFDARLPSLCLTRSDTLERLIDCFDDFTVPHGYYNATTYAAAQPQPTERSAWIEAVASLLDVNGVHFTCEDASSTLLPPNPLASVYAISWFSDRETNDEFCILHETSSVEARGASAYAKGWGLVVVPAVRAAEQRDLHFAAPHAKWDLGTPQQAAALFKATYSRSLLIAGRVRSAYLAPTECALSSKSIAWKTDPARDIEQPFFNASVTIYRSQMKRGCDARTCAFIQLHGKGSSTCAGDHIFLSSGLGASAGSLAWYSDSTPRPVKTLKQALLSLSAFPSWTIALPVDDPSCTALMATTNIFGRYINGVRIEDVCIVPATVRSATGMFIHVEQAPISRGASVFINWTRALEKAFLPISK